MLKREYLKRAKILGSRVNQLIEAGRPNDAEKVNFQIQDLDFRYWPHLAGPRLEDREHGIR